MGGRGAEELPAGRAIFTTEISLRTVGCCVFRVDDTGVEFCLAMFYIDVPTSRLFLCHKYRLA